MRKWVGAVTTSGFAATIRNVLPCRALFTRHRSGADMGRWSGVATTTELTTTERPPHGALPAHNTIIWSATTFPVVVQCRSVSLSLKYRHCSSTRSTWYYFIALCSRAQYETMNVDRQWPHQYTRTSLSNNTLPIYQYREITLELMLHSK